MVHCRSYRESVRTQSSRGGFHEATGRSRGAFCLREPVQISGAVLKDSTTAAICPPASETSMPPSTLPMDADCSATFVSRPSLNRMRHNPSREGGGIHSMRQHRVAIASGQADAIGRLHCQHACKAMLPVANRQIAAPPVPCTGRYQTSPAATRRMACPSALQSGAPPMNRKRSARIPSSM